MTDDREIKTSSCEENNLRCGPENKTCPRQEFVTRDLRGTQLPNREESDIRSSLIRSFNGPRIITGLLYFTVNIQRSQDNHSSLVLHCKHSKVPG